MSSDAFRPFLINKDVEGNFRLTVRDVRYNSQGYPLVTNVMQAQLFKSAAEAKTWARVNFQAKAGQYASK
ncbi:MAG: hypothetical protein ACKOQ3_09910 [Novosphingobium sp.]